jgi:hypothetical protein
VSKTTWQFIGSDTTRHIQAECSKCKCVCTLISPFAVFRHCGTVDRVPEDMQSQFLNWTPALVAVDPEMMKKFAARTIRGESFGGEFEYERSIP